MKEMNTHMDDMEDFKMKPLADAKACFREVKTGGRGRPHLELTEAGVEAVKGMAAFQATEEMICASLGTDKKTLHNRWNERAYLEAVDTGRQWGKLNLLTSQFSLARKNATMAIFLGKNYLGQTDNTPTPIADIEDLTPLADMINGKGE